jgi:hypothetical protein
VQQFLDLQVNRFDPLIPGDPSHATMKKLADLVRREALVVTYNDLLLLIGSLFRTPIQSRRPGSGPIALASGWVSATGSAGASPAGSRTATWERASRPRRSVWAKVIAGPPRRVGPLPYRPRGQQPALLKASPIELDPITSTRAFDLD